MKIAFLTQQYPHPKTGGSGGIGTAIKNLAQGLISQNHNPIVLIYEQQEDAVFEDNGVVFYQIKNVKTKFLAGYFTRKKIERLINKLYSEKKIDIVESPDWTGISSFIKPQCPLIIRQNGSDAYFCYLDGRPAKIKNLFHEKRALRKADGIISVSQFTGDLTNTILNLSKPFSVIPNSIDINDFKFNNDSQHFKVDKFEILYFGNIIRKKGALELPFIFNKVIEKFPDVQLSLVGKDVVDIQTGNSTWQMMQELFSKQAISNVKYHGTVDYNAIQSVITQSTLCVFPSFAEALPVSWLEAMAMQKAIVASNIGWANEMIEDGKSGFLVDPKNHDLFALRIIELLENPNLITNFGEMARKKIESDFSNEVISNKNIQFYSQFIK
jgi:glycosyltransferase involved in cell wall biosynthesis